MSQPSKEQVRKYQQDKIKENSPPDKPEDIRRKLGWDLAEGVRKIKQKILK